MTGIYKITSPSGKIYVGQSKDIHTRWKFHKKPSTLKTKHFPLYRSFAKYGHENHKFEILLEVCADPKQKALNDFECWYVFFYKAVGVKMLNAREPGNNGAHSPETLKKIGEKQKGKKVSIEARRKMSLSRMGNKYNLGVKQKLSPEQRERISKRFKGKPAHNKAKPMPNSTLYEWNGEFSSLYNWANKFDVSFQALKTRVIRNNIPFSQAIYKLSKFRK